MLGAEKAINKLTGYKAPIAAVGAAAATGASAWAPNNLINASSASTFAGTGSTDLTDSLQATVSTVVTEVLNNGNLVIYGHQNVQLNNESSILTVQGIVRPSDIGPNNTINSTQIANADIQLTGSGVLTDKQHPGWGTRIFDWVWPF
jgi:flagellar L-ring protein precursor FlgH